MKRRLMVAALAAVAAGVAEAADDAAERRSRAIALSKELRDPTAANLTLYESESAVAGELKAEIYSQLAQGKSREAILQFFAARYGEGIRYAPAMTASTAFLWAAPWVLMAGAGAAVFLKLRRLAQA